MKMKKIMASSLAASLMIPAMAMNVLADEKGIDIKSTIKDENLQSYISTAFDQDQNGFIDEAEAELVKFVYCSEMEIETLEGLEVFEDIEILNCSYNKISEIDISHFKNLEELFVNNNQLTKLDMSNNKKLDFVECSENKIKDIDVSMLSELNVLGCADNELTYLDVSNNSKLQSLNCACNKLPSINVSKNPDLEYLQVNQCGFTSIDVSKNLKLRDLYVGANSISTLDISKNELLVELECSDNKLTSLDISNNPLLANISVSDNNLEKIDVSKCKSLTYLNIARNKITKLDVTKNTALDNLDISCEKLDSINLSKNTELRYFSAISCDLPSIDVSKNTALEQLELSCNKLTSLDVTNLANLSVLVVNNNDLTSLDLSKNEKLSIVMMEENQLKDVKFAKHPDLKVVTAYNNQIATMDLSATALGAAKIEGTIKDCIIFATGGEAESDHMWVFIPAIEKPYTDEFVLVVDSGAEVKGLSSKLPVDEGATAFAERLYSTCLGRTSELTGKQYWAHNLGAGVTGADVAFGFFFSPEFTDAKYSDAEYVNRLYKTFMDREADKAGLDYWTKNLKDGMTREDVFYGFINSTEWADCCLKAGILSGGSAKPTFTKKPNELVTNFAERLYTTCLGRESDSEGIKYWAAELANMNISGTEAAKGFFFSPEFESLKLNDQEYITRLYLTFMDREPEEEGMVYWVEQMSEGCTRMDVFVGFSAADEFINICVNAGIVR